MSLKKGLILPPGLIAGSKLGFVLESATLPCSSVTSFDKLRIPFRAVATDIQTGAALRHVVGQPGAGDSRQHGDPGDLHAGRDRRPRARRRRRVGEPARPDREAMGADIVIAVNVGSSGAAIGGQAAKRGRA